MKQVSNVLRDQMVQVERNWSNAHCSRRESLQIVDIPETVNDSSLEETVLKNFYELGVSINLLDIQACHDVEPSNRKNVIIKMSRRKDVDRV